MIILSDALLSQQGSATAQWLCARLFCNVGYAQVTFARQKKTKNFVFHFFLRSLIRNFAMKNVRSLTKRAKLHVILEIKKQKTPKMGI